MHFTPVSIFDILDLCGIQKMYSILKTNFVLMSSALNIYLNYVGQLDISV